MNQETKRKIWETLYEKRDPRGIKSDFGRTLLIGGSFDYPGAIAIASSYAALSGTSFQALAVPKEIHSVVFSKVDATVVGESFHQTEGSFLFDEKAKEILSRATSVLIGNGIARTKENGAFLSKLLHFYAGNLVIDATGLTLLADEGSQSLLHRNEECHVVLTPHLGEARSLLRCENLGRESGRYVERARAYCQRYGVTLLLKSYSSVVVDAQESLALDEEPTSALGKAGSGDALAGFLAGLLSYGTKSFSLFDLTSFASEMIHQAAKKAEEEIPGALLDVLSIRPVLRQILASYSR